MTLEPSAGPTMGASLSRVAEEQGLLDAEGHATWIWYQNCRQARIAGAAPMSQGTPGYRLALDADGDGVACEPYYSGAELGPRAR
jgi:hypothetical protein